LRFRFGVGISMVWIVRLAATAVGSCSRMTGRRLGIDVGSVPAVGMKVAAAGSPVVMVGVSWLVGMGRCVWWLFRAVWFWGWC
jgi:hypothetical protein